MGLFLLNAQRDKKLYCFCVSISILIRLLKEVQNISESRFSISIAQVAQLQFSELSDVGRADENIEMLKLFLVLLCP